MLASSPFFYLWPYWYYLRLRFFIREGAEDFRADENVDSMDSECMQASIVLLDILCRSRLESLHSFLSARF